MTQGSLAGLQLIPNSVTSYRLASSPSRACVITLQANFKTNSLALKKYIPKVSDVILTEQVRERVIKMFPGDFDVSSDLGTLS